MLIKGEKYACEACVRGHRVSNCQHADRPLQHINKKVPRLATYGRALLIRANRVVPSPNVLIAELFENLALLMSVVTAAAIRHMRREPVPVKAILKVSFLETLNYNICSF
jgi:hypothetical protein